MARKRIQKQTDRTNIDRECLQRLNAIHSMIKSATSEGTVAVIPKYDTEAADEKYNLLNIKQTRITNKARSSENTSKSTIYRDLALLRAPIKDGGFEAPIVYDYTLKGYKYTDKSYELVTHDSSPENLIALATAKSLLSSLSSNSPVYKQIAEITAQITDYTDLTKRIAIAPRPKEKLKLNEKFFTSISENIKVKIIYQSKTKTTELIFSPFQLIFEEQSSSYYLYGQAEFTVPYNKLFIFESFSEDFYLWSNVPTGEVRKCNTVLKCSQIDEIKITQEHFSLPQDFNPEITYLPLNIGTRKITSDKGARAYIENRPEVKEAISKYEKKTKQADNSFDGKIIVKGYNKFKTYIKEQIQSDDLEILEEPSANSITVSFTPTFPDVLHWLLSFGPEVTPLSPQTLVENWKNEIIKSYKKNITEDDLISFEEMNKDIAKLKKS